MERQALAHGGRHRRTDRRGGGLRLDVGMIAFIIAAALVLLRAVDEAKAIQRDALGRDTDGHRRHGAVALLQETQGLRRSSPTASRSVSTPTTIEPVVAFGTGLVSVYSSTSGVVLPAFLPMVPELAARLGGIEPLDIAWSMNVSASLVDLSSLSTVGALYIAGAAPGSDTRKLFNALLAWGLSMTLVGALLCWLLFG